MNYSIKLKKLLLYRKLWQFEAFVNNFVIFRVIASINPEFYTYKSEQFL